jgi:hypothetical protein
MTAQVKNKDEFMIKTNDDKEIKDEKKLLNWQSLVMVGVLLLSIMLLLPEYDTNANPTNTSQDQSQMNEMISSAGN